MDEEIKELLEKNLKLNEEILERLKKVHHFVMWQRVMGFVKILLIVVPIVLGIIYLPAILENALAPYKELLNMSGGTKAGEAVNQLPAGVSPDLIKKYLSK